jgi:hypothetical protein
MAPHSGAPTSTRSNSDVPSAVLLKSRSLRADASRITTRAGRMTASGARDDTRAPR